MYDIFISYRHEGGFPVANDLANRLKTDGYRVCFDKSLLKQGKFDEKLLKSIEEVNDFIVILDEHVFDRTIDGIPFEKDWVRRELSHAIKLKKNIIPIMLPGFKWPDSLPEDIKEVNSYNGPEYNRSYFDNFYIKLKDQFLISRPSAKKNLLKPLIWLLIIGITIASTYFVMRTKNEAQKDINEKTENKQVLMCGSGTVKNFLYSHFDTAVMNKYIYFPSPSSSFSTIFQEEKSWGASYDEMQKRRQYYAILLSAFETNDSVLFPNVKAKENKEKNDCIGYIMGIKLGECKLRVFWKDTDNSLETLMECIAEDSMPDTLKNIYTTTKEKDSNFKFKGFLKVNSLATAIKTAEKTQNVTIYTTTTKTSGTYKGFQNALNQYNIFIDSMKNVQIYYDNCESIYYEQPYIILGNEYYFAENNEQYPNWGYLIDDSNEIVTIPLYVYFLVYYKNQSEYEIPDEVKNFLKDIKVFDFYQLDNEKLKPSEKTLIRYFDTKNRGFIN